MTIAMLGRLALAQKNMAAESLHRLRMIDIGANLLDGMFSGSYNDKQYHEPDVHEVLQRSWNAGESR